MLLSISATESTDNKLTAENAHFGLTLIAQSKIFGYVVGSEVRFPKKLRQRANFSLINWPVKRYITVEW